MIPGPLMPSRLPDPPTAVQSRAQSLQVDSTLRVEFLDAEYDSSLDLWEFRGGTTAIYGETRISAPTLMLDLRGRKGSAKGGVSAIDPEGTLRAESLEFDWGTKTGRAKLARIQVDHSRLEAAEVEIGPEEWTLRSVKGSLARIGDPPVHIEAAEVTLRPGKNGVARRVYLVVLGKRLGPIPRLSFNFRKRIKGIGVPSITNRRGSGLGLTWDAGVPIGDHSVVSAFWNAFPREAPALGLGYATSPLNPDSPTPIQPSSDLGERASDGWFNNIAVPMPSSEVGSLRERRLSYGVGTFWNQQSTARTPDSRTISKQVEGVYEMGGERGGFGYRFDFRAHSIRPDATTPFRERAAAQGTVSFPAARLAPGLTSHARVDVFGNASRDGSFAWLRSELGVLYAASRQVVLGTAYVSGYEAGRPDFEFDRLSSTSALHVRLDARSGPYIFRYLVKWDVRRREYYDREYEFAIVAGPFEPFLQFRQFPSDTRLGVRLRIDPLIDRLQRRDQGRKPPTPR